MILAFSVGGVFHRVTLKTLANAGTLTMRILTFST